MKNFEHGVGGGITGTGLVIRTVFTQHLVLPTTVKRNVKNMIIMRLNQRQWNC